MTLLIFDGFADWEPALACAELNKSSRFKVTTASFGARVVESVAGLRIAADHDLSSIRARDTALLIVPGGDMWESGENAEVSALLRDFESSGTPVAAICGGTLAAAHAGLLDDRSHASNYPGYIDAHVPGYSGKKHYREESAVTDRGVVTASGMGSVEFAHELLRLLNVYNRSDLAAWLTIFRDKVVPRELRPRGR